MCISRFGLSMQDSCLFDDTEYLGYILMRVREDLS